MPEPQLAAGTILPGQAKNVSDHMLSFDDVTARNSRGPTSVLVHPRCKPRALQWPEGRREHPMVGNTVPLDRYLG